MASNVDARLKDLGITIPDAPAPAANYVAYTVSGNLVFVSGQVPRVNGEISWIGKVGREYTLEQGQ